MIEALAGLAVLAIGIVLGFLLRHHGGRRQGVQEAVLWIDKHHLCSRHNDACTVCQIRIGLAKGYDID